MTRINSGIKSVELPDKLLLAELREIKRIPNQIRNGRFNLKDQPVKFTLGTGHVKFFYDKLGYLLERYQCLRAEAVSRNFNVQDFSSAWDGIEQKYMNSYVETIEARNEVINRINERGFKLLV